MNTYCISCVQHPERRAIAEQHFAERHIKPIWWRGLHGASWGLETRLVHEDGSTINAGAIGNLLSHYMLWQHLFYAKIEAALVLEDDAVLCENFSDKLLEFYWSLPSEWDFAYVGYLPSGVAWPYGTFSYLVRWKALERLLDRCARAISPVDCQLIRFGLDGLRVVVVDPPLAVDRTQMLREWSTSLR